MIKSLILELNILNKEVFDVHLSNSTKEITELQEKIQREKVEVAFLT